MLAPAERETMRRQQVRTFSLSPDVKSWGGFFPNPLKVLDSKQSMWTAITAVISSATFVFSPVAMTVIMAELVGSRVQSPEERRVGKEGFSPCRSWWTPYH